MDNNKTWNESSTLIIIPILNGDIASSIPSSGVKDCAEAFTVSDIGTAVESTLRSTFRCRGEWVPKHPCGTNGTCHSAPTLYAVILVSVGYLVFVFWVCCVFDPSNAITGCYTRYCSIRKCC